MQRFQRATVLLGLLIGILMLIPTHSPVSAQGGLLVLTDNADVTGTGLAVAASSSGTARYADAIAPSGNSAVIRCGNAASVSATVGKPIAPGGAYHWEAMPVDERQAVNQHYYSLITIGCYVANGDKVNFSWVN